MAIAIVPGSTRTSNPPSHRRTWRARVRTSLARLRAWWASKSPAAVEGPGDWSKSDLEQLAERAALPPVQQRPAGSGPSHVPDGLGESGRSIPLPTQPRPHQPFAPRPTKDTHVAIRMQRILTEASWDPELTPSKLWASLRPLVDELCALVEQEQKQPERMERNQAATAAQRVLLDDALHGADPEAIVTQAAASMVARATHVGSETPTGMLPVITDDMPDPRVAGHDPLDAEAVEVSPVHAESGATVPAIPEQRPESDPLPKRETAPEPEGMAPPLPASMVPSHPFLTDDESADETEPEETAPEADPEAPAKPARTRKAVAK